MTYLQLKAGLNAALQTIFPMVSDDPKVKTYEYYGLEVIEGYTTPCFFTRLETGESRVENHSTLYHSLIYSIMYIPEKIDEIDLMNKVDKIRDLFQLGIEITAGNETRFVDCKGFDWGFGGSERDILEISVDIEYLTDIRKPESAELMADAKLKMEVNGDESWNA
jgi:hypothetical protein